MITEDGFLKVLSPTCAVFANEQFSLVKTKGQWMVVNRDGKVVWKQ